MADNLRLLKNIFAELEKPLFFGDGLAKGEFHALMQPGQFVSTNLTEADGSDDMAIIASLTDDLIDTQFIYTQLNGTVSQQYTDILNNAALPYVPLSAGAQAEIDADTSWLATNQQTYTTYQNYYYDALGAYDQEANSQHPNSARLLQLQANVNQALNNWQTMGKKNLYEAKQARVVYLSSGDPQTMWNGFKNNLQSFNKQSPHRGPYVQTFLIPPVSQWNSAGWAQFEKTINETDTYSYSSSTSWGGGGSVGWGLFSIGGGASGSSSYSHSTSDVTTVNIKFEYMRARIDRRWLKTDIFGYRFWWWKKVFGYRLLSDGGNLMLTPPQRPIGLFPFLPNYLIVARKLTITSNFSHNDATTISHSLSASASAGWGPFSVSGSYSESSTEKQTHATFDGTTIRVDQPQVIAFTGTLMPLVPSPDRTLPWQGDQAPFDPPAAAIAALKDARREEFLALSKTIMMYEAQERAQSHYYDELRNLQHALDAKYPKQESSFILDRLDETR
jgi:hypothetical protein